MSSSFVFFSDLKLRRGSCNELNHNRMEKHNDGRRESTHHLIPSVSRIMGKGGDDYTINRRVHACMLI